LTVFPVWTFIGRIVDGHSFGLEKLLRPLYETGTRVE